jgi:thiosulfate dehydrogenase (quinone) large subunit
MSRNDRVLAGLRIAVGALFLLFGEYKLVGSEFVHGGFASWIHRFIEEGAYPFMKPLLRGFVLSHAFFFAWLVALGETAIGLVLVLGLLVRTASACGFVYMLGLLFSSNYPGPGRPLWQYFGASLDHSVLALCFAALALGDADKFLSTRSLFAARHRR